MLHVMVLCNLVASLLWSCLAVVGIGVVKW